MTVREPCKMAEQPRQHLAGKNGTPMCDLPYVIPHIGVRLSIERFVQQVRLIVCTTYHNEQHDALCYFSDKFNGTAPGKVSHDICPDVTCLHYAGGYTCSRIFFSDIVPYRAFRCCE